MERTNPDLSALDHHAGGPYHNGPFAVYARWPGRPELVARNFKRDAAIQYAQRRADDGAMVHVSLDTCG